METYERTRDHGTRETVAGNPADRIAAIRRVVAEKQYAKIDGVMMDLFSASYITQVYDALNPENKIKFASFPAARMAGIAFKLAK